MAESVAVDVSIVKDKIRTFDWEDKLVEVRRFLPFNEAFGYVNDVVMGCLDENGNYLPEALDFMRRYEFINYYTNIALPNDTAGKYEILYGTELYAQVYELVDLDQLDVLWAAINMRIDAIRSDRRSFVEKQMIDIYSTMKNLLDVLNETVGDLTGEQVTEFLKTVANTKIDEGKIVSAIMDAKEQKAKEVKSTGREKDAV